MSDILNHYHCAREAFHNLPDDHLLTTAITDNFDAFRLGTQGPDFFYYDVIDKNQKLAETIARTIHTANIDKFFYYGLKYAQNHPEYSQICLAYLAGFASHHALDTYTHPFIFNRTGIYDKRNPQTYDFKNLHKLYEILLDTAMTQYEYSRQAVFESPEKVFIVTPYTLKFLESFYNEILPQVYGFILPKNMIKRALSIAVKVISFCKDPLGRFNKYFKPIEKKFGQIHGATKFFYPMYTNEYFILNIGQKPWQDPVTGKEYNYSYPQLFHRAVDKTRENFDALSSLYTNENFTLEEIGNVFENKSYFTGHNANEENILSYFDRKFAQDLSKNY